MDLASVAADQMVPTRQGLAERGEAVAAGVGQPGEFVHILGRNFHAIGHQFLPIRIAGTAMAVQTKLTASHIAERHLTRIFILHPDLAAQATAIA